MIMRVNERGNEMVQVVGGHKGSGSNSEMPRRLPCLGDQIILGAISTC